MDHPAPRGPPVKAFKLSAVWTRLPIFHPIIGERREMSSYRRTMGMHTFGMLRDGRTSDHSRAHRAKRVIQALPEHKEPLAPKGFRDR